MGQSAGTLLIVAGLVLVAAGLLAWSGLLGWFGRLPGDIRFDSGGTRIYIPITSMVIVSIVLSVVIHFVRRLLG